MRKIYPKESEFIVESYKNGMSTTELGKLLNRNKCSIGGHLKLKGVSCRHSNPKKYTLNDNYFDNLNSEGPAYWLGALIADGSINGNRVTLTAKTSDIGWLNQLKNALGYDGPIYTAPSKGYSTNLISKLSFTSKHMRETLQSYGIDNDKTHSAHFCAVVPKEMRKHHIRGLIDGDGSFMYSQKSDVWGISLVGTKALVTGTANHLSLVLNLNIKVSPHKMIYAFTIGGIDNTKKVASYLYDNSIYYLERKKERAMRCLQRVRKTRDLNYITPEIIEKLFNELKNWSDVASRLDLDVTSLYQIRRRFGMKVSKEKTLHNITEKDLLRIYDELGAWYKVANFYDVSSRTIRNKLKRFKELKEVKRDE